MCYLWLQINFTLLNCSREDLCCHSFGLDPLCKQLTCATVKGPNEQARMARRDRPRGGAVRIHQNLGTPSVTMETAERVGVCGMGGRQVDPPHQLPWHQTPVLMLWTNFISFCNSISPSGLFNECGYRHHHLFHCFSGVRVHGIVWDLIAFNIKTHRGRYYTEQGVFQASNGTLRLLPASFARLWGVMHCYSWLVLAGIKAKGLLYFYTLPPPQSPRWNQPWTWDCHWPIEKDRKREREGWREAEGEKAHITDSIEQAFSI